MGRLCDLEHLPDPKYYLGEDNQGRYIVATGIEGTHLWTASLPLDVRVNEAFRPFVEDGEVRLLVDVGKNGVKQPAFVRVDAVSGNYQGMKIISKE